MVGELWEEGAIERIDDDIDEDFDPLDDDVELDDDLETWRALRRYVSIETEAGE